MQGDQSRLICFNGFTLDLPRGCLRRGDAEIRLRPKLFDVLRYLVQNRGRLISKDELIGAVWPNAFVTDNSLVQCMIEIRRALDDDGQTMIRTVPRRGYILDGQVDVPPAQEAVTTAVEADLRRIGRPANGFPRFLTTQAQAIEFPGFKANVPRFASTVLAVSVIIALAAALNIGGVRQRLLGRSLTPNIQSIAVLPLEGLANDADLDYFADGMTDALITDLAQIAALRVISRTTMMQYKKAHKPLAQIGRELDVDAIVEGTATRSDDRVRITTQLVLAREDKHVWAHSYEGDLKNILALQDDVARDIAGQIQVRVTPEEKVLLTTAPVLNSEAYDAYLKSRQFIFRRTPEGARKRVEYAEHALALQPDNAILQRVWETP